MAIALKLGSDGYLNQIGDSEALQADAFERKQASGDLLVGSTLGASDELRLGSSSAMVRSMGDARIDGYIEIIDTSAPANPSDGEGRLYKKTGDDGLFWLPDSAGSEVDLTGGLSSEAHRAFDQLTHEVDEDYYAEYAYSGNQATSYTIWTSVAKTLKIREYTYSYTGAQITGMVVQQYNGAGAVVETLTYTYTWSGSRIQSETCVRS